MKMLFGLALAYCAITAAIGYEQGKYYGKFFGATRLAESIIQEHSSDWATASPLFWIAADQGLADAQAQK